MNNKKDYWNYLLQEVLNKKAAFTQITCNPLNNDSSTHHPLRHKKLNLSKPLRYPLGQDYQQVMLTKREAECISYFIKGKTIASVATILNLSPRTVEFYTNNVKKKLKCRTKSELIGKILATDFTSALDFQIAEDKIEQA